MDNYPVPIDVNQHAAAIEVRPEATIITFAHANFTMREMITAPKESPENTGPLVFFQVESVRPMTLTFSFTPDMEKMWPALNDGPPSAEWVPTQPSSGFYILHLNLPDHAAAIAMPSAEPGIMQPYQERAASYPTQFILRVDPAHDSHSLFPLLVAFSDDKASSTKEAFARKLLSLDQESPEIFEKNRAYYTHLLQSEMTIETPDTRLDQAFAWAGVSIDQLRVQTTPGYKEEALTAGFLGSGDSARPGFGWFFGRDALWTLYALNSIGQFQTTRQELEFILARQSPEGKIFHEWSQTASLVDWKNLPYEYAAADATALLPMAMNDYLHISGDRSFIESHWENLARAWHYECSHDSDGDGIYDNASGTAWVESWIPAMPKQEIYLALLDEQASIAFSALARATDHNDLATQAEARVRQISQRIEEEYYLPAADNYAFSWEGSQRRDTSATIFPSVAWWDGDTSLAHPEVMLSRWATEEFSTDWGTRLISDQASIYDPISYHQGTVWPLFTGWVALAEYRTGHTLSGYAHLMQNAEMTWSQDQGNVTELLSGRFFEPLGRSTAHQLWSSAMVISPIVRGLFGLEWNAAENMLTVTPHLPADWPSATIRNVPFGDARMHLHFTRTSTGMLVKAENGPPNLRLTSHIAEAHPQSGGLLIPLPPVEVAIRQQLPEPGATTTQMKVLEQRIAGHELTLKLRAQGGSVQTLLIRENSSGINLSVEHATLGEPEGGLRRMTVVFPAAEGYTTVTVRLSWKPTH
jgi:glycogen debranching enzyme